VAYELAQQIEASGEKVEMLLIIDATAEDKGLRALRWLAGTVGALLHWDDHARVDHFGRWGLWRGRLARWSGLDLQSQARIVFRRILNRFVRVYQMIGRPFRRDTGPSVSAAADAPGRREYDMPAAFLWASARYRPQPYHGPVALLLSDDVVRHGRNVTEWQELAPKVTVHPLRGTHLECITAHVDALAQTIESCLRGVAAHRDAPVKQSATSPSLGGEPKS
jgi:hypothetical protein